MKALRGTYRVIATIQSGDNEPVEMRWYTGEDPLKALVAVGQAMETSEGNEGLPIPVRLLSVRIDVQSSDDSTTPITERGIGGACGRCGETVYDVGLVLPFNADGSVHDGCTTFTVRRVQ